MEAELRAQGGAETPCKDVYVARGQVVNVACGGGTAAAPACTNADGFKSVGVKRKGKGLRISFKRKVAHGVTVSIYQTSKGRHINKKAKRVARFRNRKRGFTWNGRKTSGKKTRVARGVYFVRFSITRRQGQGRHAPRRRGQGQERPLRQEGQVHPRAPLLATGSVAVYLSASVQIWPPPSPMC